MNGQATRFLHDGDTPVKELNGAGATTADLLAGPGTDEFFARTDTGSGATTSYLTDALGSTVGLVDASGQLATGYSYDPFGNQSASGAASANRYQFAGRDNDATGLQYNRARYYSPELGRFVSEDPIGFAGGDINLYGYVANNPVDAADPSGLSYFDKSCLARQPTQPHPFVGGERAMAFTYMMSCYLKTEQPLGPYMKVIGPMLIPIPAALGVRTLVMAARLGRAAKAAKGGLTWAERSGILRAAAAGKGDSRLGWATAREADEMGRSRVGQGYAVARDGRTLVSKDGLRQYRPPSWKRTLGRYQANFERRFEGQLTREWQSNGHLELTNMP